MTRERRSAKNLARPAKLTPPPMLPRREAEVWRAIVRGQSPGWLIKGCEALLEAHVRTVIHLQALYVRRDQLLADTSSGLEEFNMLDTLIDRAVRRLAMTSRSLRLTQQSRVRENIPKDQGPVMPWEQFGDEEETA